MGRLRWVDCSDSRIGRRSAVLLVEEYGLISNFHQAGTAIRQQWKEIQMINIGTRLLLGR